MKKINLFWIIWIFVILESKDVNSVSYPGVYRNEVPLIVPGATPIENVFVTERYGINYECIETCYPILSLCDDQCAVMPDLPECLHCQRFPAAPHPTPIIIETPPYEPRQPSFEQYPAATPIVSYPTPSRVPSPPMFPKRQDKPSIPKPSRPIIPKVPLPPRFEELELVPPTPLLPDIPQTPQVEIFPPELPSPPEIPLQPTVPNVPQMEIFPPELPSMPESPNTPPTVEIEPPQPMELISHGIPRPPQFPQFEIDLPPPLTLPDIPIDSESLLLELDIPKTIYPYVPLPPKYDEFVEQYPIPKVPDIVQIPNPISPERPIIVTTYPESVFYPETTELFVPEINGDIGGIVVDQSLLPPPPPIVNEYQDICSDYCLLKRNISECEVCLKTGVPAEHLALCSNCLINPSEPECQLCYPILLNLCKEYCIFEENEPDCSSCYPQPLVEVPITSTEEFTKIPTVLPSIEYIPSILVPQQAICPEYCVLMPTAQECGRCNFGIEVVEKVCVDICAGYCLDNPNDEQCAECYTTDTIEEAELPTLEIINYQCCYDDYCIPMPRNGICPVVCKEMCKTACSNDCFNPSCPDCQELVTLNEYRRTQFMIWLKSKLSDMKSRYMAMIEACIRRTELMYERELQAIEVEVDTSLLLA